MEKSLNLNVMLNMTQCHYIHINCDAENTFLIQENQLKKVRAKQKRLQAILGGDVAQRVEAELLAEDDEETGEESILT